MTALLFVDANVLLYAHDRSEPVKRPRAMAWLEYLWRERLGRTSTQVLSEVYVNLTRRSRPSFTAEEAWQRVSRYFEWDPLPADEKLMRRATEVEARWRISWWDSMVVAAAQLQDCEILLTEDLQDGGMFGSITVRSPFTLELRQAVAPYTVAPLAARLHRPRGRPRRTALA
jgi:predicted nucleic acid-binding protein